MLLTSLSPTSSCSVCVKVPLHKVSFCSIEHSAWSSSGLSCCTLSNGNNKLWCKPLVYHHIHLIWPYTCAHLGVVFHHYIWDILPSVLNLMLSSKSFYLTRAKYPGSNLEHLMPLSYILLCFLVSFWLVSWAILYTYSRWLFNLTTYFSVFADSHVCKFYSKGLIPVQVLDACQT